MCKYIYFPVFFLGMPPFATEFSVSRMISKLGLLARPLLEELAEIPTVPFGWGGELNDTEIAHTLNLPANKNGIAF